MVKIFETKSSKESYAQREVHTDHFVPYKCHWDRKTILTKNNELLQVIKVEGYSFETADDEDLDVRKNMRNLLFKNMASGNITLYFHTIRRKKPITDIPDNASTNDAFIEKTHDFMDYLKEEWDKRYAIRESFFNELYISILFKPDTAGAAILEYWYKKLLQKSDKTAWEADMREMAESLEEMSNRVINTFKDYGARLLEVVSEDTGDYCEILEFLGATLNCGHFMPMRVPKTDIGKYIPNHRLFFGSKSMEIRGPEGTRYAGIVSVREYGPTTYAGVFDRFLQQPFEFVMTQSFVFANRTVAIGKMQLQQDRMIQAEDKAVSQIREISTALDMAMSGDIGFGEHHISMLCIDHSLKALENTLSIASVELSNCGMQPVRETVNLEPSFWGQLPGNIDYIIRKSTINTLNLASFASMHNYPIGKITGNHWGDYVTVLDTTSGTPYYFSFHVRDVGHSLIIGPTGAGKTVLMNFLCAQAQKFKPRMYFFDKDHGAEIFIRAMGGVYTDINPGEACGFNPCQLPDNGENRVFLLELLRLLVTVNGETLSAEDIKALSLAVDGNYKLNFEDRRLSNIAPGHL